METPSTTNAAAMKSPIVLEKERLHATRLQNLALAREALRAKNKRSESGFDVRPVEIPPPLLSTTTRGNTLEEHEVADTRHYDFTTSLYTAALGIAGSLLTKLVVDYTYPRLRAALIDDSNGWDTDVFYEEEKREEDDVTMYNGQSLFRSFVRRK